MDIGVAEVKTCTIADIVRLISLFPLFLNFQSHDQQTVLALMAVEL